MVNKRNEEGKSWTELFKRKAARDKQSKALKVQYPRLINEDMKDEAGYETGLFI
ncbi:MAG: hypothetical protein WD554_01140 [Flavobacteriaceae bacterium]